jgi:hypothetical protein
MPCERYHSFSGAPGAPTACMGCGYDPHAVDPRPYPPAEDVGLPFDHRRSAAAWKALAKRQRAQLREALATLEDLGCFDGAHHKQYAIDRIARALTGDGYEAWVLSMCDGDDGPNTYSWGEGIAP